MRGLVLLFLWAGLVSVAALCVFAADQRMGFWDWVFFIGAALVWWQGFDALWQTTKRYLEAGER